MGLNYSELAWAAGFFEGEGCIYKAAKQYTKLDGTIIKTKSHIGLSVDQSYDPYTLHRFIAAVGLGKVNGPYSAQQQYKVFYTGEKAYIVLAKLFPYLSPGCVKVKKFMNYLENDEIVTGTLTKALNTTKAARTTWMTSESARMVTGTTNCRLIRVGKPGRHMPASLIQP